MATKNVRCRAAEPEFCPRHGRPRPKSLPLGNLRGFYKEVFNEQKSRQLAIIPADPKTPAEIAKVALDSSLVWEGAKPIWWKKYVKDSQNHPKTPTTPELMDIINTPEGEVAVIWNEQSQEDSDQWARTEDGMMLNAVTFHFVETGAQVAYLKASFMNDQSFEESYGSDDYANLRWNDRYGGRLCDLSDVRDLSQVSEEEQKRRLESTWLSSHLYGHKSFKTADGRILSGHQLTQNDIPDLETVKATLKKHSRELETERRDMMNFHENPFVEYSRIHPPLKGQGYGTALYIYMARKLAQRGQILRGSSSQTPEAKNAWVRFKQHLPEHVKPLTLSRKGKTLEYFMLDFR